MYILIEFALLISTLKSKSKNWLYRSSGKHHKDIIMYIYIYVFTNPTSHELFAAEGIAASPDQLKHWKLGSWLLSIFKDSPQICLDYSNLSYWKQACGSNQIWSNFYQHRIIFFGWEKIWCIFSSQSQRLWQFAVQRAALSQAWSPLSPSGRDRRMPWLPWRDEDIEQLSEAHPWGPRS